MKRNFFNLQLLLFFLILLGACSKDIGDECEANSDCGERRICDLSGPGGYCTITPCQINNCPDEAVCVLFDRIKAFCMVRCNDDNDCRGGYCCSAEYSDIPYCIQCE